MALTRIIIALLLCATCNAQKFGISSVVTFTNRIIPNILHALSFDHENVVFSPFGLSSSLAMVLEGLDNKLAADMIETLHLEGSNLKQTLRVGFKSLLEEFEKEKDASDSAGSYNSAYVQSTVPLVPEYKTILENFYKSTFLHNKTSANSTDLVLQLHSDTGVMSHWKDFDKLVVYTYLTHQPSASFITSNGTTIEVPMIPQVGTFRAGYINKLSSQAVELFLETKRASLFLIMPDYRGAIKEVLAKLLREDLASLPASLPLIETEVTFPQFVVLNNNLDLSKTLQKLGLRGIFKPGPVKSITQNAYFATSFVSVNSIGSTNTTLYKKLTQKRKRREASNTLTFNRPFLFFLLHKPTGVTLLAGIVQSPSQVP